MLFSILVLGCALLPTAFTLKCYTCTPTVGSPCTDVETDCPPDLQCGAMRIKFVVGGRTVDTTRKSCAKPGTEITASMNLGTTKTSVWRKYCTSDLCNAGVSESSSPSPNGMKCWTCSGQDCDSTLDCVGDENRCVSTSTVDAEGGQTTLKGCASKIMCSGVEVVAGLTSAMDAECCEGNLCNNAQRSGSSFLLLPLACVLSVTLFN